VAGCFLCLLLLARSHLLLMIAVMSDFEQTKTGDLKIGRKILRHEILHSSQQHSMAGAPLDFGWATITFPRRRRKEM
jgi:hypothetical protein